MSAPANRMGRGNVARTTFEAGGLSLMVRGFPMRVKPRRHAEKQVRAVHRRAAKAFRRRAAPKAALRARGSRIADRLRQTAGNSPAPSSDSVGHSRRGPHLRLRHPAHRPATSTLGKVRMFPEPSASDFRSTSNAHSRNAYRSRRQFGTEVAEIFREDPAHGFAPVTWLFLRPSTNRDVNDRRKRTQPHSREKP
jgi:hypothetical protein